MEEKIQIPEKIVIFISGKSTVLVNRLKALYEGKYFLIDNDYASLLSRDDLNNYLPKDLMYQTQRAFGTKLHDGTEEIIIILKDSISLPYIEKYEELSKEFHKKDCRTIDIETTNENLVGDETLFKFFFFVSGRKIDLLKKLIIRENDSVFISGDATKISTDYLRSITNNFLTLIALHTRGVTPEQRTIFKYFPPYLGYGIASAKITSYTPVGDEVTIEKLAEEVGVQQKNDSRELFVLKVLSKKFGISKGILGKYSDPDFIQNVCDAAQQNGLDLEEMGLL